MDFEYIINNIDVNALILSNFLIVVILVMVHSINRNNNDILFYRKRPDNLPIPLIQYLGTGRFNDKTIWLMILDFIGRDFYELSQGESGKHKLKWKKDNLFKVDDDNLRSYEKNLMFYINSYLVDYEDGIYLNDLMKKMKHDMHFKKRMTTMFGNIVDDIKTSYGKMNYANNYFLAVLVCASYFFIWFDDIMGMYEFAALFSALMLLFASVLKNLKFNLLGIIESIILCGITLFFLLFAMPHHIYDASLNYVILFNPLLIVALVKILKMRFYSQRQKDVMKKVQGLKNFLRDATNLKDRSVDYINFVKEYYVLAEALDIKLTDDDYLKTEYKGSDFLLTLNTVNYTKTVLKFSVNALFVSKYRNLKTNDEDYR